MVRGDIERLEVVVVVFDFRPFGNPVTGGGEDGLNPLQSAGHRMQTAAVVLTPAGQCDIDRLRGETSVNGRSFKPFPWRPNGPWNLALDGFNLDSLDMRT